MPPVGRVLGLLVQGRQLPCGGNLTVLVSCEIKHTARDCLVWGLAKPSLNRFYDKDLFPFAPYKKNL